MKKSLLKIIFATFLFLMVVLPTFSYAQEGFLPGSVEDQTVNGGTGGCGSPGLGAILCKIHSLLNAVIPVIIALGIVYFVWGVVQYVIGDSEEAKKKGRDRMIFGIIGLAVIISLWGIVYMLAGTFELDGYAAPSSEELNNLLPRPQ